MFFWEQIRYLVAFALIKIEIASGLVSSIIYFIVYIIYAMCKGLSKLD
jgi:hypothetical protein